VSARAKLGRIFGPDTLELLDEYLEECVQRAAAEANSGPRWLTIRQASERYGLTEPALRGRVPFTRQGARILIDRVAYDRQLAERARSLGGLVNDPSRVTPL
jgi:flavin-dependent dehydrogenase